MTLSFLRLLSDPLSGAYIVPKLAVIQNNDNNSRISTFRIAESIPLTTRRDTFEHQYRTHVLDFLASILSMVTHGVYGYIHFFSSPYLPFYQINLEAQSLAFNRVQKTVLPLSYIPGR